MQILKKITLAVVAIVALLAFTFASPPDAAAQSSPGCSSDNDCNTGAGEVCYNSECVVPVCGLSYHQDDGPTIARFPSFPGNAIVVVGANQDTYDWDKCLVDSPGCSLMYYESEYVPWVPMCGNTGVQTRHCTNDVTTCWTEADGTTECAHNNCSPHKFRHKNKVRSGKYAVTDTGEICDATGFVIVELTPCALGSY